jgi:hypothetical protein
LLSIYGPISRKTIIRISFIFKAILLTFKIDLRTSSNVIGGKGIFRTTTNKEKLNMSLASAVFVSNSLTSKAHFFFISFASKLAGYYKFIKGGLL